MNTKEVTQLSTGYQSIRAYIPSVSTLIMAFMLHYRSTHTSTHAHAQTHQHTPTQHHTQHDTHRHSPTHTHTQIQTETQGCFSCFHSHNLDASPVLPPLPSAVPTLPLVHSPHPSLSLLLCLSLSLCLSSFL